MKHLNKYLSLALALALCLSLAACGESNEDYGDDGSDYNLYGVPDSFEGLVKDSEQMANLYLYGGAWTGEDGGTLISATSEAGDEVRFALYDADEEVTASGFIQFVPDYDYDYFYNEHDGVAYRSWFDEVGALHVAELGTFTQVTGDGRGDVIAQDDIPVLMGGALPFTNMQKLLSENHDDGTYRYEDITEDGQLLVVNTAEQSCFVPDVQELDDYLTACALSLSDAGTYELLSAEEHEEYSKNLSYPVYIVTYTAGENEDTREWTVFVMDTDICTYLYGFCAPPDAAADMGETYQNIFSQLYLSDLERGGMSHEEKKAISSGGTGVAAFPAVYSLRQYGGANRPAG